MIAESYTWARNGRPIMWGAIGAILFAPLIAMQFTDEVAWTPFDFGVGALLLCGAGLLWEAIVRTVDGLSTRIALGVGLILAALLIWAEGAVGII